MLINADRIEILGRSLLLVMLSHYCAVLGTYSNVKYVPIYGKSLSPRSSILYSILIFWWELMKKMGLARWKLENIFTPFSIFLTRVFHKSSKFYFFFLKPPTIHLNDSSRSDSDFKKIASVYVFGTVNAHCRFLA